MQTMHTFCLRGIEKGLAVAALGVIQCLKRSNSFNAAQRDEMLHRGRKKKVGSGFSPKSERELWKIQKSSRQCISSHNETNFLPGKADST